MDAVAGDGQEWLDLLDIGVAVFDERQRLVHCNAAFRALRRYPGEVCAPGVTLGELLAFNARRGDFGPGDPAAQVAERLAEIDSTEHREVERVMADGQVLLVRYRRTPSGGLMVTFEDRTAERQAQAALAASEERYALVSEAAEEAIYEWNIAEGRFYASPRLRALIGRDVGADGARGWDWDEIIHPDDRAGYLAALEAHLSGEVSRWSCEYRLRDATGAWRWVSDHGTSIRGADGRAERMVAAIRDITERVENDAALAASEERHTLVSRATSDGIYDWNVTDDVLYVSDNLTRILNFDFNTGASRMWAERVHPEDYQSYRAALVRHFTGETEALECEYRVRGAGGGYRWIQDRGIGVRNKDGRVVRVVGAVRDVTAIKQAAAELERTEGLLASSLATISDGILLVDAEHRVQLWNDRYYQIFSEAAGGADLGEVIVKGRPFAEMIRDGYGLGMFKPHPDGVDAWVEARMEAWERPVSQWELELGNGSWILLNERMMPDGGRVSVYTDITELKRREAEAGAARQRFEEAIEAISAGFVLFDAEDRLVICNSRFRDYFRGLADMVAPGVTFRELLLAGTERGMFGEGDGSDAFMNMILDARAQASGAPRERHMAGGLWLQITDHRTRDGGLVSIYSDITELKTNEQQAQAARQRFEDAIEAISAGFALFDAEDRLVIWNARFRDYFSAMADVFVPGATFREMIAASIDRGLFPAAADDPEGFLESLLRRRSEAIGKVRENLTSSGQWLQITDHRTAEGGIVSVYTDVTALKASEQEASAARQRFEEAIESVASGFVLWDAEDRMVVCNSRYRGYFPGMEELVAPGITFTDLITEAIHRGMFPDSARDPNKYLVPTLKQRANASGEPREQQMATGVWLQITDHRTKDGGLVSIYTDVTELRSREQESRAARQRFEEAIEAISSGFSLWDAEERLVTYNARYRELYADLADAVEPGVTIRELLMLAATRGLLPEAADDPLAYVERNLEMRRAGVGQLREHRMATGIWLQITDHRTADGGIVSIHTDVTELKNREEELRRQSAILEQTLENMGQGITMVDQNLRTVAFNRKFFELMEFPPERFGKGFTMEQAFRYNAERGEYGPGDIDEQVRQRLDLARKFLPHRFERTRPDGTVLEIVGNPMQGGGLVATYTDITERKRADEALKTALAEFDTVIENIDYGILFTGPDLRARICNRAFREMWGVPQELIDQRPTFREMLEHNRHSGIYGVPDDDWDDWVADRIARIKAGSTPPTELRRADGRTVRYQCVALPDGGRMLTYFDITEMKRAEQVLRDNEARLRGILENSPIGVAVIDDDNIIRFHNSRFAEILHGKGQDLVGLLSRQFWTDLTEREQAMQKLGVEGQLRDREVKYRGLDGGEVWSRTTHMRAEWESKPARLSWIYDISEEKANREALVAARDAAQAALADLQKAQTRLVQAEKMASLGQLTAGIAHEIKNPLNFVNNFAKLSDELLEELAEILEAPIQALDAETRDDAEDLLATVRENLGKINQHGRRADSIVKNMLLHSREGPAEQQTVALNPIADEALNLAYHGARAENPKFNIEMKKALDPAVGEIECFPQDIMRVCLNLITNGMYAANKRLAESGGAPPEISLGTRAAGERVEIEVRDNGTGIPPEVRDKIFNPFFTTKPAGEGTGLGLSLSYDIVVKQHGGELTVESEPGEFTAFRIILPRVLPAGGKRP